MALVLALVAVGALVGLLLRGSTVQGASKPDVAPAAPANLRLLGFTDQGASLTWPATTDLSSHRVAQWVRERPGSDRGTATGWQEAEPGEHSLLYKVPGGLKPDTDYCFVVQAVRSKLPSEATKPACARSPQGDLPPPEGFAVEQPKKDAPLAVATWQAVDGVRYELLGWNLDPAGVDERVRLGPVEGATISPKLRPGVNCFVLRALRGSQTSKLSAPKCVTFETQPGQGPNNGRGGGNGSTGGPPPSPDSPAPGRTLTWVSFVKVSPISAGDAERIATEDKDALRRLGFDARTINTTKEPYPGLPQNVWAVVVVPKGAPSQRAAEATCTSVKAKAPTYTCQATDLSVQLAQPTPGATGALSPSPTQAVA
jgi:hypothetical protein